MVRGPHPADQCFVLIGVRLALLCPKLGLQADAVVSGAMSAVASSAINAVRPPGGEGGSEGAREGGIDGEGGGDKGGRACV